MSQDPGRPGATGGQQSPQVPPQRGNAPYGHVPHGQEPYGQAPYGQAPYGQPQPGSMPPQPGPAPGAPVAQRDERFAAVAAHLSIPFFGFLGPLFVRLAFSGRSPWLKETIAEALNFSIVYSIAQVVSLLLVVMVIGVLLVPLVGIAALLCCILGALAAHRGELYRYPVNFAVVK